MSYDTRMGSGWVRCFDRSAALAFSSLPIPADDLVRDWYLPGDFTADRAFAATLFTISLPIPIPRGADMYAATQPTCWGLLEVYYTVGKDGPVIYRAFIEGRRLLIADNVCFVLKRLEGAQAE